MQKKVSVQLDQTLQGVGNVSHDIPIVMRSGYRGQPARDQGVLYHNIYGIHLLIAARPVRFVTLVTPRRAFQFRSSSVGQLYRAMFATAANSDLGTYDLSSSLPTKGYACFERAVVGWESLSEPITGPQNAHLV